MPEIQPKLWAKKKSPFMESRGEERRERKGCGNSHFSVVILLHISWALSSIIRPHDKYLCPELRSAHLSGAASLFLHPLIAASAAQLHVLDTDEGVPNSNVKHSPFPINIQIFMSTLKDFWNKAYVAITNINSLNTSRSVQVFQSGKEKQQMETDVFTDTSCHCSFGC